MQLKQHEIRIIAEYIKNSYNQGKRNLQDYIVENVDEFCQLFNGHYYRDDLFEALYDQSGYSKLLTELNRIIDNDILRSNISKIKVFHDNCYDYIESTSFGERVNAGYREWIIDKLNKLEELEDKEKGDIYEKFCTSFLTDIGFKAIKTSSSNDDGIDIIGKIDAPFTDEILHNFFGLSGINIMAQVKYRANQVDTPVIKHLIGDSMFYRFLSKTVDENGIHVTLNNNPTYLCIFSHNGFTKDSKEFAYNHGVILIDSNIMADILCGLPDWNNLLSIKLFNQSPSNTELQSVS